jgi:GH15 family glucan-1,4-alpha-glucosidase
VLCLETIITDPRVVYEDGSVMALIDRLVTEALQMSALEDTGLWEYRTMPRHYTFSKVMCWVAAHRGAQLAELYGHPDRAAAWRTWSDAERQRILTMAYNEELGYFTQSFGGRHPDASNLLLATLGIVDPTDPRFVSTVRVYERLLVENGLMLRYRHPDDFGPTTSAFTICSFWWVEALAMMGEVDQAVTIFNRLDMPIRWACSRKTSTR